MIDRPAPVDRSSIDRLLLWGFAPLVLLVALLIAAVLLVPSVAPERYVPVTVDATDTEVGAP